MTGSFGLSPLLRAAAQHLGHAVTGDVRWLTAGPVELAGITESDRALIHVVTGERLPYDIPESGLPVSFFVLQIALDRLTGPLVDGSEVSIEYVESVYEAYEEGCPDGNPISGDLFDMALAFLVGRDIARLGPEPTISL